MKKVSFKLISILSILFFIFTLIPTTIVKADEINVEARSALLIEPVTGKIIYEKNIHDKFAPASVTKIMTMLLAMESIDNGKIKLTDTITVSENAKKMGGSTMLLDTGEVRTVEEILKGIAVASGNDASVAMAEYLGGTEENFVVMMNEKAKELGMTNTVFKNCNGLPAEGHISTAYDIALMSKELLKHDTILNYTGIYMETISEGRKTPIELVNHNKLVRFFKGCDGLKTGYTEEAKYCISATATRDGVRMLTVIMGAPTFKIRNRDASMLLNYGFSKFQCKTIVEKDNDVENISMSKNGDKFFIAKAKEDLKVTILKGEEEKLTKKVILNNPDKKKYTKGEVVGKCEVYLEENLLGTVEIYADRDIKKANIFENIKYNMSNMFNKDNNKENLETKDIKENEKNK